MRQAEPKRLPRARGRRDDGDDGYRNAGAERELVKLGRRSSCETGGLLRVEHHLPMGTIGGPPAHQVQAPVAETPRRPAARPTLLRMSWRLYEHDDFPSVACAGGRGAEQVSDRRDLVQYRYACPLDENGR